MRSTHCRADVKTESKINVKTESSTKVKTESSTKVKTESSINVITESSTKGKTESAIDRFKPKSKKIKKPHKVGKSNKSRDSDDDDDNERNKESNKVKKSKTSKKKKESALDKFKQESKKIKNDHKESNDQREKDSAKRAKEFGYLEENRVFEGENFNENVKLLETQTKKHYKLDHEILRKLSVEINKISERVRCYKDRTIILRRLEEVIKRDTSLNRFGKSKIEMFGSSSTQLALKNSDVDIVMSFEKELTKKNEITKWCYQFSSILRANGFYNIKPIIHAKVPIVKFFDPKTEFHCDITLTKDSGNTGVIKEFCQLSPILSKLIIFCKNWASVLNINDASQGTLSSYSITNMLIFVLQKKGLLPSYKDIETFKNSSKDIQYVVDDKDVADLLIYFFKYYGFIFDYRYSMVNILDYNNDKKDPTDPEEELKFQKNREFENKNHVLPLVNMKLADTKDLFFIKDCIAGHNITRCIIRSQLFILIKYFQRAYINLISGKLP
ncbi:hypothetical protein ACTFIZ_001701 [Dictyostelium cf. discoideum]